MPENCHVLTCPMVVHEDGETCPRSVESRAAGDVSLSIPGIPETIQRSQVLALIGTLGIDWRDLISLTFEPTAIKAEVYALDDEGRRFFVNHDEPREVAIHNVVIKVLDA